MYKGFTVIQKCVIILFTISNEWRTSVLVTSTIKTLFIVVLLSFMYIYNVDVSTAGYTNLEAVNFRSISESIF